MIKEKLFKALKILVPISIGVYLTWYFFSNSSIAEREHIIIAFKGANYWWIAVALILAFFSHLSRAYRWKYLLSPLGYTPKLSLMYHSVMIGYIINLTIPRSGELARAGYFSKYHNASADKVFGTIVVERVIDLLMFGLVILIAGLLQTDQDQFNQIKQSQEGGIPSWILPTLLIIGLIFTLIIFFFKKLRLKLMKFIKGIIEGCLTILKLKQKTAFIFHTFFIWGAYLAMFWLTAFALPEMQNISVNATFACFVAGAIAIGVTPGGIGLYPIMVASVLTGLYGYEGEVAKSFSMLMWATQTIFIVILGLVSLFAIQNQKKET
jgi:uncharacterized protein (TIRG00374 family)